MSCTEPSGDAWASQAGGFVDWITKDHCDQLVKHVPCQEGSTILDVAAGTGVFAIGALNAFVKKDVKAHFVVTDFSQGMLDQAKVNFDKMTLTPRQTFELQQADALNLPYESNRFDVVMCAFGLFLTPDPTKATQECLRVLKPGGRLLFTSWHTTAARQLIEHLFDEMELPHALLEPLAHVLECMDGRDAIARILADTEMPHTLVSVTKAEFEWKLPADMTQQAVGMILDNPILKLAFEKLSPEQRTEAGERLTHILSTGKYKPWVNVSWGTVVEKPTA